MACGVPVVVSGIDFLSELIEDCNKLNLMAENALKMERRRFDPDLRTRRTLVLNEALLKGAS